MKVVIKIGGQAVEDAGVRRDLARQIAQLSRSGHKLTVVHGGGRLLTQTLAQLGIPTRFHHGLRVTDAATRDVALMVLAGIVNKQWVAEIQAQGQFALGICGGDARLVQVRKLTAGLNGNALDLGFVGRPRHINTTVLDMAHRHGIVPVVASLGLGTGGEYFNVNADDFAAALASAIKTDRLIYLTESGGVWDSERRLLARVRARQVPDLIRKGIVRDGMIPKLRSCVRTLRQGVHEIDIISPSAPDSLLRVLDRREAVGTRVVRGE